MKSFPAPDHFLFFLLQAAELAPNMEIMGTLMYAAGMNFYYKMWALQQVRMLDLAPNTKFLQNVENSLIFARRSMVDAVSIICFWPSYVGESGVGGRWRWVEEIGIVE